MTKELDVYPVEGQCPFCGKRNLEFTSTYIDEAGATYECTCNECGASFNECYDLVFAGNWKLVDKDGNEYEDLPT